MIEAIKNNKGFTAVIVSIIAFFLGSMVYLNYVESNEPVDETEEMGLNDSINKVNVDEVRENIEAGGPYAFILGDDTCPACIMFKNNLKHLVVDEGIKLDYIDLQVEPQAEVQELLEDLEYDMTQGLSTPTTFIIEDGEITSTVVGAVDTESLLAEHGEIILQLSKNSDVENDVDGENEVNE